MLKKCKNCAEPKQHVRLEGMQRLLETMRRLRGPEGCPWDKEQSHESLRPYLLEEAAEAVDALHTGNKDQIVDELGDVLLQIAFHAVIAEGENSFVYEDIERSIVEKLIRRHPHVFADTRVKDANEVVKNWQAIKATEKKKASTPAEQVPQNLPALMRAAELSKKLEWPAPSKNDIQDLASKLEPETVGELLLAVAHYAKANKVNAELALRDSLSERITTSK